MKKLFKNGISQKNNNAALIFFSTR